jgi:hypothetical protein
MNQNQFHRQSGATLMEVLIAMTISLVVTAAMIAMMSNSLGTTARIIHMTKLGDDMRVAMQMMTRDLRRSSYNADAMYCYGNEDCATDGTLANVGKLLDVGDWDSDGVKDCFWIRTDRDLDNYATPGTSAAGGFRRVVIDGVGVLQMWTGGNAPACDAVEDAADWVEITNPEETDITTFAIDDTTYSYSEPVLNDIHGKKLTQYVRKLHITLTGELLLDRSIKRQVEDIISVRNDLIEEPPA